ncbi:uncharacterized protein LOC125828993 [Solanum verrucosum]|uniref:uncharacterized protein LOC125828993 n=1 Tax=Solanum verrucosum TaxID=315347 RepID=UPI0020D14DAD|nr:uncharacterized protein LOC125828993 [Solanum verrucosum]
MNDQRDNVLQHMRKLWNNWRGSLHKNVKSKSLHEVLKDVPMGVDKSDWEWLVKEHFLSQKFKVVERCFGPQCKSHVVGFGGGITTKELKGGTTSKAALWEELKTTRKEKESLQKRMDILESKYEHLENIVIHQSSSVPSIPSDEDFED